MKRHLSRASLVYALASILFWSTAASAFKLSLQYADFLSLVFYASLSSTLVLASLCWAKGKFSELREWGYRDYRRSLFLGALNPALYYLILFRAYELLPAQEAQVLNFVWPMVLVLMGVLFLGQRLNLMSAISMMISFVGVAIVATQGQLSNLQFSNNLGVALALTSAVIWATYWVINQTDLRDPLLRLLLNFAAGVVWMSIMMTITGRWAVPSAYGVLGALYIGLFEMSLAFYCWFRALKLTVNVSLINNLIFLTPFLSLIVISQVLHEPIHSETIIGLIIICGSILLHRFSHLSDKK